MTVWQVYPAIDLRGGRCVRLYQGDYDRETHYGSDPVDQARRFAEEGAHWIHVVDLDAARSGVGTNRDIIAGICAAVDVPVQCGGGVRSVADANDLWGRGVRRVVVGTAALERPELVGELAALGEVAVGLDARGHRLAAHGWETDAGLDLFDGLTLFEESGATAAVVTEIGRDGTLAGPALDQLAGVLERTALDVIASGGVGSLDDLVTLRDLGTGGSAQRRLSGAICGRAIYEGAFTVSEARRIADGADAETVLAARGAGS